MLTEKLEYSFEMMSDLAVDFRALIMNIDSCVVKLEHVSRTSPLRELD